MLHKVMTYEQQIDMINFCNFQFQHTIFFNKKKLQNGPI